MSHGELLALVSFSYLVSLWGLERWQRFRGRVSVASRRALARPHVRRALAPLGEAAAPVIARLEAHDLAGAQVLAKPLCALPAPQPALLEAVLALVEATGQPGELGRYRAGSRAVRAARRAHALGSPALYVEGLALLACLSDGLTEDLRLWQGRRVLERALGLRPDDPLPQLGLSLRAALAGQPELAVAALGRALYHGRGDRFIAELVLAVPLVEELAPGLAEEARRLLPASGSLPGL